MLTFEWSLILCNLHVVYVSVFDSPFSLSLSLSLCLSVSQCFVCFAVSITIALSINNLDYAMVEAHLL